MLDFLSEESIEIHKEYLRSLTLKYSILEKSVNGIKDKSLKEITRQKLKREDKVCVLELLSEMSLHNIFFTSFREKSNNSSKIVSKSFGSEASLLHKLFKMGMDMRYGFLCLYTINDKIQVYASENLTDLVIPVIPLLAIDVCEHAYFLDYRFDKERYLCAALSHLDLSKLEKCKNVLEKN
jgi:Fe-Mn family superoxide dismutase